MAGPSVRSSGHSDYAETPLPASQTVALWEAPLSGSWLVAFCFGTTSAKPNVDDSLDWVWDQTVTGLGGSRIQVISREVTDSEPATYTFTASDSGKLASVIVVEIDLGDQAARFEGFLVDGATDTKTGSGSTSPLSFAFGAADNGPWSPVVDDVTLSICALGGLGLDDGGDNDSAYVYVPTVTVGPDPGFPDQQGVDENGGWAVPGIIGSPGTPGSTWGFVTWKTHPGGDDFDATAGTGPDSSFTYGVEPMDETFADIGASWVAYLTGARAIPTFNDGSSPPPDEPEGHPYELELEDLL